MKKTYNLSYEFLGEPITQPFDDLFSFAHALDTLMEANEVPDSTISFSVVKTQEEQQKPLQIRLKPQGIHLIFTNNGRK
ncbi:MAG: hypothetical protein JWQ09_5815 [Segetibacter sp.]|nr:hypothetical protein [Segetibacter sp.]